MPDKISIPSNKLIQDITRHPKLTHGGTVGRNFHPLYRVWVGMKARCEYEKHIAWHNYGGRGIKVCPRWHDFALFCEDMEESYRPGLRLERVDNDGNYLKENCSWATPNQESRNTRVNRWLTLNGVRKCMADWCVILGGGSTLIIGRLKRGWSEERALTTPVIKRSRVV